MSEVQREIIAELLSDLVEVCHEACESRVTKAWDSYSQAKKVLWRLLEALDSFGHEFWASAQQAILVVCGQWGLTTI